MEYNPRIGEMVRARKEATEIRRAFTDRYYKTASIRVTQGEGKFYDTTITDTGMGELSDGTTEFRVQVVIDGEYRWFTSPYPEHFPGLQLL